jgi:F-type H+-transporting ATPase subunit b
LDALGINLGYLFVQVLNFAILIIVLRAWVYKPVLKMLDNRRRTIAQGLEDARIAQEARSNAENEAQKILSKAQQEAAERVREATERADEAAEEIKAEAEKEAIEIRHNASLDAEQSKAQALGELRGQVAALAIAAAQKIIGETLDERRQHALIEEFFSGVKAGKVILIEGETLSGDSAEITSALPLTPEEQKMVRNEIIGKMGSGATISFRVDPNILGGLVVRVGDKILDGSVSGKLQGLRQSLH